MKPLVLPFSASRHGEPSTFGELIRKARLEKGLKQVEAAKLAGVCEMTVVRWEKADRLPRQYAKLKHLCEDLGLNYPSAVEMYGPSSPERRGFGPNLGAARVKKGLTQRQAAQLAGIDPGTLARWERSEQDPPEWMRAKLGHLLGILDMACLKGHRDN